MRNFTTVFFILLTAILYDSSAQVGTRVVKGTLTDPTTGEPMPGVNIVIKGTTTGTVSDLNGNYEIEAPIGSVLVFSFIGYATREITVTPEQEKSKSDTNSVPKKVFRHTIPDNKGDKTLSPYFFVKSDDPSIDQMPLKSTDAVVNIAGVIADVKVRQVYVNTGKNTIEAVYIFPGSTRAAVYAMSMTIGNRKIIAKIKEKEKARQEYQEAMKQGKTATLLEQNRPNVFQMNVANILPGDTISVALNYTELLIPVEGSYEFVYPTVVGPRYSETPDDAAHAGEKWVQSAYHHQDELPTYTFDFNATVNSGIPIQQVTCTSHTTNIHFNGKKNATIQLDRSESLGGNRDVIIRYRLRGGQVESGLLLYPRSDENFFLLMVEPPESPAPEQIPPREYIFVVDVSGSMQGFPIGVSKVLLQKLISGLRPTDKFNVMLFESSNHMLHDKSVSATASNISRALHVLDQQQGGGGTRLYPALQKALLYEKEEGFSRTFVVVTDGYVTIEKEAFNLIRDNLNEANLFAIGIGSSVNRYLIEGLAHAGMGEPFIVTSENEAEAVGKRFRKFVENPVLTSIRVNYKGFDVYDVEPKSIPDVFAERPIIIYGKYKGEPSGSITLTGFSGNDVYVKTIDIHSATTKNNEAIRYLWARNKIKYLDDYAGYYEDDGYRERNTSAESRIEKVTALGLKYNLLTQYTSFVAVDSLIRNTTEENKKVSQPLPLPQGVSDAALSLGLAGISLTPDVTCLQEVITVGYGTQSKACMIASITSVDDQNGFSYSSSLINSLAGRVPGVIVTQNSGVAGSNTSVRIRGNSSLTSGGTPLYVVDGVPLDNTDRPTGTAGTDTPDRLADLNPNDIESIEVVKSASANALYGSRGANGVILITTKSNKTGRHEITLTSSFSMERVNKLPALQQEYAQGRPENGMLQWRGADTQEMFSWGPHLSTLNYDGNTYDFDKNGRLVSGPGNSIAAKRYNPYAFFKTGFTIDNHLSIGKTSSKSKYAVSLGNRIQHGILPGTALNRTTLKLLLEKTIRQKLRVGSSAFLSTAEADLVQKGNSASSVMAGVMTTPPSFDNGNGKKAEYELSDGRPRSYSSGLMDNPYWSINKNPGKNEVKRIIPSLHAEYDVAENISVKYKLGGDIYQDKDESGLDIQSAAAPDGRFIERNETYKSLNSEFLMNGEKYLLYNKLTLSSTLGLNNFYSHRNILRSEGIGLTSPGEFDRDHAVTMINTGNDFNLSTSRVLAKVNARYQQLISLELTSAWEHSSALPDESDRMHSAGAGLSFSFTELQSLSGSVLNFGKIFTSIGRIEKDAPLFLDPNYLYAASSDINAPIWFPERMAPEINPSLKPESQVSLEAGTSVNLWQNRIELTAVYHQNKITNLMTPEFSNATVTMVNSGVISNAGVEFSLLAIPLKQRVHWKSKFNFTQLRSQVESLPHGTDRIPLAGFTSASSNLIVGQPYGVFYGTRYLRNEEGQRIIGADGFPLVDPEMGIIGDPNPRWTMGLENTISLGSLELEFLIDIRKGGDIWNGTKNTLDYYGTSQQTGAERGIKNYIFPGVTQSGEPNTTPVDFADPSKDVTENRWTRYGVSGVAEDAIEDGSWIRMRQLLLSYQIPQHFSKKIGLRKMTLSFIGRNLFLITRYTGIDPETNLTGNTNGRGLDYFNLPNYRSMGVSLKASL